MNGKQAKRLRRAALGLATTLNEAGREIKKDGYVTKVYENRLPSADEYDPKGVMPRDAAPQPRTRTYQLLVRKDSYKGIYKTLKAGKI